MQQLDQLFSSFSCKCCCSFLALFIYFFLKKKTVLASKIIRLHLCVLHEPRSIDSWRLHRFHGFAIRKRLLISRNGVMMPWPWIAIYQLIQLAQNLLIGFSRKWHDYIVCRKTCAMVHLLLKNASNKQIFLVKLQIFYNFCFILKLWYLRNVLSIKKCWLRPRAVINGQAQIRSDNILPFSIIIKF